jgi:hypothetical protein
MRVIPEDAEEVSASQDKQVGATAEQPAVAAPFDVHVAWCGLPCMLVAPMHEI